MNRIRIFYCLATVFFSPVPHARQATAQSAIYKPTLLAGTWHIMHKYKSETCRTDSLDISVAVETQADGRFAALERRTCLGKTYDLRYNGHVSEINERHILSLNPEREHAVELISPIGGEANYMPDRMTLWLSKDGCNLAGYRKDERVVAPVFLYKSPCDNTNKVE